MYPAVGMPSRLPSVRPAAAAAAAPAAAASPPLLFSSPVDAVLLSGRVASNSSSALSLRQRRDG